MAGNTTFSDFESLVQGELLFFEVDSKLLRDFYDRAAKMAEPVLKKLQAGDQVKTIMSSLSDTGLQVSSANLLESLHDGPKAGVSAGFELPKVEKKTLIKGAFLGFVLYVIWDVIVAIIEAAIALLATKGLLLLAICILFALAVGYLVYKLNGNLQESVRDKINAF